MKLHIVLFRGKGLVSALIRFQTRGTFSHAALLVDNTLYESWQGAGVRKKENWIQPTDGSIAMFAVEVGAQQKSDAVRFLEKELGCAYDYISVLRFISRRDGGSPNRWFCSELVFCALERADIHLFNESQGWQISPDLLKRSTLAERI